MKRVNIFVLLLSIITLSCSDDFLERYPKDSITAGNFFQTEADFQLASNATYSRFRSAYSGNAAFIFGEQRTDNNHFIFNSENRGGHIEHVEWCDQWWNIGGNSYIGQWYNANYETIASANDIILRLETRETLSDNMKTVFGEALFFRAASYLNLVRSFGGVPLHIAPVTNQENAFEQRATAEAIYAQVKDDAKAAIDNLPKASFPQTGRASKSSARMLLADAMLDLKEFAEAIPHLQQITKDGHDLLGKYSDVFELVNKNSVESIFELQYDNTPGKGQARWNMYRNLPSAQSLELIVGFTPSNNSVDGGFCMPTQLMIEAYEAGDERLEASIAIAEGDGVAPGNFNITSIESPVGYTRPDGKTAYPYWKKFIHEHTVRAEQSDNHPIYRYSEVLLSLAEAYAATGEPGLALAELNKVRARAGLEAEDETEPAKLRKIIYKERRVEFGMEMKRWNDLVRLGNIVDVLNAHGAWVKANFNTAPYVKGDGYTMTTNKILLPLPDREIKVGDLEQNPV